MEHVKEQSSKSNNLKFDSIGVHLEEAVLNRNLKYSKDEYHLFEEIVLKGKEFFKSRLISVLLFGSRARGDARHGSDWDFLIFLRDCDYNTDIPHLEELGVNLSSKYGLGEISLSPMSEIQFHNVETKYPGIQNNILCDSIKLWP